MRKMIYGIISCALILTGCQSENIKKEGFDSYEIGSTYESFDQTLLSEMIQDTHEDKIIYSSIEENKHIQLVFQDNKLIQIRNEDYLVAKQLTDTMSLDKLSNYTTETNKLDIIEDLGIGHDSLRTTDLVSEIEYASDEYWVNFYFYANQLLSYEVKIMNPTLYFNKDALNGHKRQQTKQEVEASYQTKLILLSATTLDHEVRYQYAFKDQGILVMIFDKTERLIYLNLDKDNLTSNLDQASKISAITYMHTYEDVVSILGDAGYLTQIDDDIRYTWVSSEGDYYHIYFNQINKVVSIEHVINH